MAIITISRGTFSGGKALAERLAERLGYPCLSREEALIDAAKEFGISEQGLTAAINEPPPFWQEVPGKRIAYLKCITATMLKYAREGNLIYHGHAGHLLLPGISHVLRVRVIANMEFRIKAAMERTNLSREQAIVYIDKVDEERNRWTRYLYGMEWDDATLYDIVLNLERVSIDGACETVVGMVGLKEFMITRESEKAVDDLTLSSRVWVALARDDRTQAAYITVNADAGKVTISGSVGSEKIMDAIPLVARKVNGVLQVTSEVGIGSDWYW